MDSRKIILIALLYFSLLPFAKAEDKEIAWIYVNGKGEKDIERVVHRYRHFLSHAVTSFYGVKTAREFAQSQGFKDGYQVESATPGDRLYFVNRNRSIVFAIIGRKPLDQGARIAVSHIDSPHIHLKARPLDSSQGLAIFQTNAYGFIKNYQWTSLPLALLGVVHKKDGQVKEIRLGLDVRDPVLVIPDLAPHVDSIYRRRTMREVIRTEELDPIVASRPLPGENIVYTVKRWLLTEYNIEEDDLVSADLSLVPALSPRDVGVDRSMIGAYAQDNLSGCFTSLEALCQLERIPEYSSIAMLLDLEEVGSDNNTGAASRYYADLFRDLVERNCSAGEKGFRRFLAKTIVMSVDTTTALHPTFPSSQESGNAARLGYGVVVKLYGRGFNAHPALVAWTRKILDAHDIAWQTHMYKAGSSGGRTMGRFFAQENMNVVDIGVALLGMHSPYEISSKVDIYEMTRFLNRFYREDSLPQNLSVFERE